MSASETAKAFVISKSEIHLLLTSASFCRSIVSLASFSFPSFCCLRRLTPPRGRSCRAASLQSPASSNYTVIEAPSMSFRVYSRSRSLSFSRPFSASVDDSFSIGRARAIGRGRNSCRAAFVRRSAPPFFVAHSRFHFVERSRCESTVSDERYALRRRSCKFLSLLFLFCRRSFVCFLLLRISIAKRCFAFAKGTSTPLRKKHRGLILLLAVPLLALFRMRKSLFYFLFFVIVSVRDRRRFFRPPLSFRSLTLRCPTLHRSSLRARKRNCRSSTRWTTCTHSRTVREFITKPSVFGNSTDAPRLQSGRPRLRHRLLGHRRVSRETVLRRLSARRHGQ